MSDTIVIGYDGSEPAQHAIDVAAAVVRARAAFVVHVWGPTIVAEMAMPPGGATPPLPHDDSGLEAEAWRIAEEGAALAADAGLDARPEIRRGATADIGGILAELAEQHDADLVVVGRRGVSRLEATVFGSVCHDTLRASRRPVLVVSRRGG